MLGLCCRARAFSGCSESGASYYRGFSCCKSMGYRVCRHQNMAHRFSCPGMWDLPEPGSRTCVFIGSCILSHWTTGKSRNQLLLSGKKHLRDNRLLRALRPGLQISVCPVGNYPAVK